MKSNKEWFKMLTEKEQKEFEQNVNNQEVNDSFEDIMNEKSSSFYMFIISNLDWSETTQGVRYWSNIAHRYDKNK